MKRFTMAAIAITGLILLGCYAITNTAEAGIRAVSWEDLAGHIESMEIETDPQVADCPDDLTNQYTGLSV